MKPLTARHSKPVAVFFAAIFLSIIAAWGIRHMYHLIATDASSTRLTAGWIISFMALAWTNVVAFFDKPVTTNEQQDTELNKLNVAVLVPAYNEDPAMLWSCIRSLLLQSRKPQTIYIVDDGSKEPYSKLEAAIAKQNNVINGVKVVLARTANMGKRHAQAIGINATPEADIYLTVDSDTVLDPRAVEECLKPFADKRVTAVGGVLLALNNDKNILTRFSGVWEVVWQLIDRSNASVFHSVTVNSGPLAMYRADIIRKYLDAYLNETFFGRPVKFSDDSMLTTFALMHGRTVQQTSALCFSATPERVSHHIRRYVRWMRGSFIRSWWRIKYLPLFSYGFLMQWFRWVQLALSTIVFFYLVVLGVDDGWSVWLYMLAVPVFVTYLQSLRYLSIVRSDQSLGNRVLNYMLSPLAAFWTIFVLRPVKWYAYVTCWKTGWGTRKKVEISS